MKALTLTLFLSCFCLMGMAQERTKDSLMKLFEQTLEKEQDARKNNDYPKAVEGWTHYLKEAAKYPADIPRPMEDAKACYQIGCMYALNNSPKEALKMLEKSIDMGLDDYWNLATDDDMKSLKDNRRYQKLMLKMKAQSDDFSKILKQSAGYTKNTAKDIPAFTYMDANDSNLVRIRNYFNLDSIAGTGDEISKIKNLLTWVHNVVRHDGSSMNPKEKNAIAMVEVCKKENRGINCRMMAQLLNECYLAMGFKSRFVTCMPQKMINDCHVINSVYSKTLNKWLWMDPTFNAYVTDEKGNLLGIAEVRERLRNDQPLTLNEDANWNNQSKQTKLYYLDYYMAKNLYYVVCPLRSEFNAETNYDGKVWSDYVALVPEGFLQEKENREAFNISDSNYFWQAPN
ncbi:transglutaminase domain-containing protein [uncultured Bacteroides sp.]|uniref:TPR end-of-group domain-containing protein n=1 Tax=uncultured Bacteroides sp. TaxID=162156 RepID=UPI0025EC1BFD|nr:transglutaminase domain-containing protein [uncultured Bacteroides sp.]